VTLKMEAVGLSETLIPLQTARCHILANCDHRRLCCNTVSEQTAVLCNTEVPIGSSTAIIYLIYFTGKHVYSEYCNFFSSHEQWKRVTGCECLH